MANKKNAAQHEQALISKDFFDSEISVNIHKIFPVAVIATMSSGKSTLINALLEKEILPNSNAACTSKVFSILDKDDNDTTSAYVCKKNKTQKYDQDIKKVLADANVDDDVKSVLIVDEIKKITNTNKSLLIIDTPGPNNSSDINHEQIMKNVLDKLNGGMIIYVINATQNGILDDKSTMGIVKHYMLKIPRLKIVFVVNKIDELDFEKESVEEFMNKTKEFISESGFQDADIIPVSALGGQLFKKVLKGIPLTRHETSKFDYLYELFKPRDVNLITYAHLSEMPNLHSKVSLNDKEYRVSDLMLAIEHTGIDYLTNYIQNKQISSENHNHLCVKIK
jgi:GTPase Era involved in 16S rRNA processing